MTIQIALDKQSVVTIALYNINGQMLETIVEDVFPSGLLSKSVSLTKYASGVYFMRTNLNAQTSIDKIHLLK
ncbi:MAG: T9SS type A sorting domain-containing protein [bacterium]|nr:T9SS type A sorting domain-containing protein [bacterium]MBK8128504.1 T9SS type A sorting domain-containing protein [bacterium]